jgi:pimeloyl-ACP methyl ester carboxylesterase
MNFLIRPDAEKLLAEDDYKRLWRFFGDISKSPKAGGWLTDAVKSQYRGVWQHGLTGPLNFYRASPLRPGPEIADVVIPRELLDVHLRTLVVWGMGDIALPPGLLDGLADFVPHMELQRVEGASHWIIHEQPMLVAQHLARFLANERYYFNSCLRTSSLVKSHF